ncbi:hypothetical protein ACLBV0_32345, partial [Pseudomonas aeruginosa]|uniref:hypothetical protein n=1 Tax=Pseudomonas aeruginosa TaxID=287 RepID=UPI00396A2588
GRPQRRPRTRYRRVQRALSLIPLALRGVRVQAADASQLLQRNLLIYGVGGLVAPFLGIKAIDLLLTAVGLA